MPEVVAIDTIIADSRCQSRTGIDLALVQEYADAIADGAELPPLSAIQSADGFYLYDGFHRLEAYRQAGVKDVAIDATPGDIWSAIERSCSVNNTHGKRRTNADKHRAVATMLKVMEHRGENWTDREIARRCAVSNRFVSNIRPSVNCSQMETPRTVSRNGTTYEMNTARIGQRSTAVLDPGPNIDEDTGEILNDYPEAEEVDPNDPATFDWSPPPVAPTQPTRPARDFDPEPIAAELVRKHGRGRALEIADSIYQIAE